MGSAKKPKPATTTAQNTVVQSETANAFRRWGYLQAEIDDFGRIDKFTHREIENQSGPEAEKFKKHYCGKIGAEFMHIPFSDRTDWIAERLESSPEKPDQQFIFNRALQAEVFEKFIHTRYVGAKRFSLEGLGAMIPLFDSILEQAADDGVERVLVGMAHRGRLTALWSVFGSSAQNIFSCFEDVDPKSVFGAGDVKYHRGATGVYKTRTGKELAVHLASNPSHLEAINPVVAGRTKAWQDRIKDTDGSKVLAILVHGDAAFAGQGITAETLNLAEIEGFNIGGTVHIIANNLVGFTASPHQVNSSRFESDLAKRLPIPVFHVNAEYPEDVYRIGKVGTEYRDKFKSDIVIDLIGYRRLGHNEGDDPTFTLPTLYHKIEKHPYLYEAYGAKIGLKAEQIKAAEQKLIDELTVERDQAQTVTKQPTFFSLPEHWSDFVGGEYQSSYEVPTAVTKEVLAKVTDAITTAPKDFTVHPKLSKLLEQRREMGHGTKPIDFGMAEQLAFGSLLVQGVPVRLSGQDCRRATFSQRQSVMVDYKTGKDHYPLNHIQKGQATYQVYDSILSEAAVMGFEYGYSRDFPEALVLWEGQFGDFANGAQIIIDQFLSAGEDKWGLLSGLTLLLPHGFEGQGPEHSSARLERFLQLCAEDNMQVVQPSTAAQYFHVLRRQALRKWRKPLIVITPKSMLRNPAAASQLEAFTDGSFQTVIPDNGKYQHAERVVLCAGKISHDIRAEREKQGEQNVAVVTLEQFYPFPEAELADVLESYSRAKSIVWAQEEPANMGALNFVRPYLEQLTDRAKISTVRRSASASPATGSAKASEIEQKTIVKLALAHSNS